MVLIASQSTICHNLTSKIKGDCNMATFGTTRMSSKGQVVIPEEIRERLGFAEGVEFIVIGENDAIVLKAISAPSMSDFDKLLKSARTEARKAKLTRTDVKKSIRRVRRSK